MASPRVVVVMARCADKKNGYGIRFEEAGREYWLGNWAFAINDKSAEREGYDKAEIHGSFDFDSAYPGCPHCRNPSIFRCSCGKVACWNLAEKEVRCPWCNAQGILSGTIDSLGTDGDR